MGDRLSVKIKFELIKTIVGAKMTLLRTIMFLLSLGTSLLLITGYRVSSTLAWAQEDNYSEENAQTSIATDHLIIFALSDEGFVPLCGDMRCCKEMLVEAQRPMRFYEDRHMPLIEERGIRAPIPFNEVRDLIPPEVRGKVAFIGIPEGQPPAIRLFLTHIRLSPSDLHFTPEQRKSLRQLEKAYFESLGNFLFRTNLEAADIVPLEKKISLLEERTRRVAFHILKPLQNAFFEDRLWRDKTTRIWDYEFFSKGG